MINKKLVIKKKINNKISKLSFDNKFYEYNFINIKREKEISINSNHLYLLPLKNVNKKTKIKVGTKTISLNLSGIVEVKKKFKYKIYLNGLSNQYLVASLINYKKKNQKIQVKATKIYKVKKPWGYELWYTGKLNRNLIFKKIFIKKGTKTSLQFHKKKIETNFLSSGKAKIHYFPKRINLVKKNYPIIIKNIKTKIFSKGYAVNVPKHTVHRIEAQSDLLLYEVSTPQPSDVIRISDDTKRGSGKIQTEHS